MPLISRLISGLVVGGADRHVPHEGVVEDQDADAIVGLEIFHDADGGEARQFDLLAFHGRRLVDDQHDAGALRRARRHQFRREGAGQRVFGRVFVIDVNVAFAGDHERAAAALHEGFEALLVGCGNGVDIDVVEDDELRAVEIGGQGLRLDEIEFVGRQDVDDMAFGAGRDLRKSSATRGRRTATAFSKRDSPRPGASILPLRSMAPAALRLVRMRTRFSPASSAIWCAPICLPSAESSTVA